MEQLQAQLPLFLLVTSRVAGVTASSPVFANRFLTIPVRVFLTFLLALLILPAARAEPGITGGLGFAATCLTELLVGLLIGFLGQLVFAVLQMAGAILDLDMGLAMAEIVDPVHSQYEALLGSFFHTLGLVIYFTVDAHHWLLRAIAGSYAALPAGAWAADAPAFRYVVELFGALLAAAVQMVLPFVAVMLLTTAVLGAVNRAVQQFQLFQITLGVKAAVGLVMLAVVLPYLLDFVVPLFESGHRELLKTLQWMQAP
ncbi:MAG TPA: flagellar biosynthetic protein FliR [Symbiobacteriaceae bacterium]